MPHNTLVDFGDSKFVKDYLRLLDDNKLRHASYEWTVAHEAEMSVHVKGDTPVALLEDYRPNEDKAAHNYRIDIYEPITKAWSARVINVTAKIRTANASINFTDPQGIIESNPLSDYTEKNYPKFGSITEWVYSVLLDQMYADPNSIITIFPRTKPEDESKFLEPIGVCYRSDQLYDYDEGNYYTILMDEKSLIEKEFKGNIWKVFTRNEILKIEQTGKVDGKPVYGEPEVIWEHKFDETPVFFIGGDYLPNVVPYTHKSYMSGVIPFWNKAIRVDSDLDANYVSHMFSERVEIEQECGAGCKWFEIDQFFGHSKDGVCTQCVSCKGTGKLNGRGPFGTTVIKKEEFNENPQTFPGVQYINKPTDIVELSEKKVENLKDQGFSALNMDILNKVGANNSGVAKTIDRTDLNSFLQKISDNIYDNIMANSYKYINMWRYGTVLTDDKLIANLPTINKPTRFDVMTINILTEEYRTLKEAGASDETLSLMEKEIVNTKFINDLDSRNFIDHVLKLDPMPNKQEGDKVLILSSGGTTKENYVISTNIKPFLIRAVEEDASFYDKKFQDKVDILKGFSQELMANQVQPLPLINENGNDA